MSIIQNFGDTEITEFDGTIGPQEDVWAFYISMQDFFSMHKFQSKQELQKPV